MKKRVRLISLALIAMASSAQQIPGVGATTNNTNPASIIWGLVAVLGAMGSAWIAMSLIWTAMQGATSDHEQFHKLPKLVFWAAILFSATYLSERMALGV